MSESVLEEAGDHSEEKDILKGHVLRPFLPWGF